ncbi:TonB-dependent siderophore receptor [Ferrimonas sp. SCSIO 43195]|uniref:TonB-dependent siderophore receptor n=1 Tax=Ferrimonas sp. SCSIO 43195 TaxID=2822844 RepID=UPI002075DFF5|nr:TonB-dependent siderophore receptor [Ferrimonas sp. SCSIO 43195]USD39057.1 TonB-dependent siderophore receptor [Ferrimonas sp. SCSIO 43195]
MFVAKTPLFFAIASALGTLPALAESAEPVDENMVVTGVTFDNYKADTAKGAMRADVSLLETPQSVTVIPEIIVDEQLATTLGEVLINDASVTAGSKKWNREVFSLRGFELDSGSGYLRNGQQAWSHYVHPIETLERIEVLKGPSSMLYGQSAPGGLINMVTKKPTVEPMYEFGFDVDEYGSTRFQADAGGALNEAQTLRYRATLVKQDAEYWREYQDGSSQERDRFLGALALEYDLSDWGMLSVHYDLTKDKTGIDRGAWLDDDGSVIGDDSTIWDMPWAFTDNEVENYGLDLDLYLSMNWTATLGFNHQMFSRQRLDSSPSYDSYMRLRDQGYDDGRYEYTAFDRYDDWQYKTYYADFNGTVTALGAEHQLLIGANMLDYYYGQLRDKGDTETYIPGQSLPPRPDLDYNNDSTKSKSEYKYYGFYLQDLITLNENWQLLLGGRYDIQRKEGSGNDSESFVPKVSAIYHPAENGTIYLSYSESFQPQGEVSDPRDANDGMNLDPETGESWELGTKWELADGRLLLDGALFDITKTNVTTTETLEGNPEFDTRTTQGGKQQHRGAEFSAQGQLSQQWFVMTSVMYLDAQYKNITTEDGVDLSGNTPVDAPEWSASAWTRYKLNDQWAFNLGAFYEGERFATLDNSITKDAYVRIDAGASYKLTVKDVEMNLRLNVENLFDENYIAGGTNTDATIGDGRNFRLSAQFAF